MDILYLVKECDTNEELVYSLRSLVNLPHNRVFFVGGCPKGLQDIIHIPVKQAADKYQNSLDNLITACKDERLSNDFILMNDDFFILKKINDLQELNLNRGKVEVVYNWYMRRYPNETIYMNGMRQTLQYLQSLGVKNPLSFELHFPMLMNKENILKMFKLKGIEKLSLIHKRTLYGNLYIGDSKFNEDNKILGDNKAFVPGEQQDKKFLSCSDKGWQKIKKFISDKFSTPSIYEKPLNLIK